MEREERERCWFYSELQGLTQRLAQLPHIDTVRRTHTHTHRDTVRRTHTHTHRHTHTTETR